MRRALIRIVTTINILLIFILCVNVMPGRGSVLAANGQDGEDLSFSGMKAFFGEEGNPTIEVDENDTFSILKYEDEDGVSRENATQIFMKRTWDISNDRYIQVSIDGGKTWTQAAGLNNIGYVGLYPDTEYTIMLRYSEYIELDSSHEGESGIIHKKSLRTGSVPLAYLREGKWPIPEGAFAEYAEQCKLEDATIQHEYVVGEHSKLIFTVHSNSADGLQNKRVFVVLQKQNDDGIQITYDGAPAARDESGKFVFEIPDGVDCNVAYAFMMADETDETGRTERVWFTKMHEAKLETKDVFEIVGANMNLGNALDMNFFINAADLKEGKEYYVVITKAYADKTDVSTVKVEQSMWQKYNSNLWFVTLKGIGAKEMNDKVTARVFYSDGTAASSLWEDSVVNYVKRAIAAESADKYTKDLMVDMLRYGAAAQIYFNYDTGNLADSWLAEAGYGDCGQTTASATDQRVMGEHCMGSNLNLGSSLGLNVFFENVTSDMYAIVTYKDHNNKDVSYRVNYGKFVTMSGLYGVPVNTLSAADADTLVTCTLYNGNGTVYGSAQDNIASYLARMKLTDGSIYTAIKKFCDSANAYFHRQY